ncbi:MAG TPA: hypothetical protein VGI54_00735 [Solirubrobacteraceae bacterium]
MAPSFTERRPGEAAVTGLWTLGLLLGIYLVVWSVRTLAAARLLAGTRQAAWMS